MASTPAAAVIPHDAHHGRRHWDHKVLAEQWVSPQRAGGDDRLWLGLSALGVGVALMGALIWVMRSPAPAPAAAAVVAATAAPASPAAPSAEQASQARLQKMRDEQIAFLSKLASHMEAEPAKPQPAPAPKKAPAASAAAHSNPVSKPAAQAPASTLVAKASPAPATSAATAAVVAAPAAACKLRVADLSASGTLTYDRVSQMHGAVKDPATGVVRLPPVDMDGGRVVFDVRPNGCVEIVRSSRVH